MTGFFKGISKHEVSAPLKGVAGGDPCYNCKLYEKCNKPRMEPYGKGKAGILLMGEAPGEEEDRRGIPFVGKSGDFLKKSLYRLGIDMDEDCFRINAVNCRPTDKEGNNRKPNNKEINSCRFKWKNALKELKPKKLILLGGVPIESFVGERFDDIGGVERWVGWTIPDQDYRVWVYPNYHPSHILRQSNNPSYEKYFKKYLKQAIEHDEPFKETDDHVVILTNESDVIEYLN